MTRPFTPEQMSEWGRQMSLRRKRRVGGFGKDPEFARRMAQKGHEQRKLKGKARDARSSSQEGPDPAPATETDAA